MSHWKKSFPSRYLQVSDLDDGPIIATIKSVSTENVGSGDATELKLVLHFKEAGIKNVVLNLTRAEAIETIVGDPDTDKWPGHRIRILKGTTRYQGKRVPCISIGKGKGDDIDEAMPVLDESEAL
jgi:hypothetical protein